MINGQRSRYREWLTDTLPEAVNRGGFIDKR